MTNEQMTKVLDQIVADDAFCDALGKDPRAAVKSHGVTLTDEEAAAVQGMSRDELRAFASEYKGATDPSKRRAAC